MTTGPLSNLAAAAEAHPDLVDRVDRVVCLAGTHEEPGVLPLVERNVWCDPEAAAYVLAAGFADLTFVGMDATFAAPLVAADAAAIAALGTRAGRESARMLVERIAWYERDPAMSALGAAPLHDPMAVAHVLAPDILGVRRARASVDLADGPTYGRTVYDLGAEPEPPTALTVALTADHDRFMSWLLEALSGVLGAPEAR